MKLLKDILKVHSNGTHKFSQGRIYLFVTFLAYLAVLIFFAIKTVACDFDISVEAPDAIISALQWAIALFAGYVFGGKGLEVIKILMNKKNEKTDKEEENKDEPKKDGKQLLNENDPEDGPVL